MKNYSNGYLNAALLRVRIHDNEIEQRETVTKLLYMYVRKQNFLRSLE